MLKTTSNENKKMPLKRQIRGVERLIHKPGVSEEQRKVFIERLDSLKKQLLQQAENSKQSEKEKTMAKRYRMVKFFERRKLLRKKEQIEKKLLKIQDENETKIVNETLTQIIDDMLYIKHFPKDQKYIALFSKEKNDETALKLQQKIRQQIKERVNAGELSAKVEEDEDNIINDPQEGDFVVEQDDFFIPDKSSEGTENESNTKSDVDQRKKPIFTSKKRPRMENEEIPKAKKRKTYN